MSSSLPRFYVEKLKSIEPDMNTGIVKLTFSVTDKSGEEAVVQLVVSAPQLHEIFGCIDETMQTAFALSGTPGRPGGSKQRLGMRMSAADKNFKLPDITGDKG
jgi:hypothetical protein